MSYYNMLFGVNSNSSILLATLGLTSADVPRFRDCFIEGGKIVVYTSTGSGNREYYESEQLCRGRYPENLTHKGPWNSDLHKNEYYLYDEDDFVHCTYASFYFRFPEQYAADLNAMANSVEDYIPSERWQRLYRRIYGE